MACQKVVVMPANELCLNNSKKIIALSSIILYQLFYNYLDFLLKFFKFLGLIFTVLIIANLFHQC